MHSSLPIAVKVTPSVSDSRPIAAAVEAAGADALTVMNTMPAMAIDIRRRRPVLATSFGGLSGPAIKPIALRMVHQVHRALPDVPLSGIGGITTGEDVAEFLLAGATTVQVGTQSFAEPGAAGRILDELAAFCVAARIGDVRELIGALR